MHTLYPVGSRVGAQQGAGRVVVCSSRSVGEQQATLLHQAAEWKGPVPLRDVGCEAQSNHVLTYFPVVEQMSASSRALRLHSFLRQSCQ